MDYTLLYPVVFALLWLARLGRAVARAGAARGRVPGRLSAAARRTTCSTISSTSGRCSRRRRARAPGSWHISSARSGAFFPATLRRSSAATLTTFHPAGAAAWVHAAVAILAVAVLIYRNRAAISRFLKSRRAAGDAAAGALRDRVPGHVRRRKILAAGTPHAALPAAALPVRQHRHRGRGRGLDRARAGGPGWR